MKKLATDKSNEPELWPANVLRLRELNIPHTWSKSSQLIEVPCPRCQVGAKLVLDWEQPWCFCTGAIDCTVAKLPFAEMLDLLSNSGGNPPGRLIAISCRASAGLHGTARISVTRASRPKDDDRRRGFEKAGDVLDRIMAKLEPAIHCLRSWLIPAAHHAWTRKAALS